jgi:hypothetical protein
VLTSGRRGWGKTGTDCGNCSVTQAPGQGVCRLAGFPSTGFVDPSPPQITSSGVRAFFFGSIARRLRCVGRSSASSRSNQAEGKPDCSESSTFAPADFLLLDRFPAGRRGGWGGHHRTAMPALTNTPHDGCLRCKSMNIMPTFNLAEPRCPACRPGIFARDPNFFCVSWLFLALLN